MAGGFSNSEIAIRRVVSTRTVEGNVNAIFGKLGLRDDDAVDRRVAAVLIYRGARPDGRGQLESDELYSALAGVAFIVEAARRTLSRDALEADDLLADAAAQLGAALETVRSSA